MPNVEADELTNTRKRSLLFLRLFCLHLTEGDLAGHVFYKTLRQSEMFITVELLITRT